MSDLEKLSLSSLDNKMSSHFEAHSEGINNYIRKLGKRQKKKRTIELILYFNVLTIPSTIYELIDWARHYRDKIKLYDLIDRACHYRDKDIFILSDR